MTMPSSSANLRQHLNLKRYLAELAELTGRHVRADELVGLEQTAALRACQQKFKTQATTTAEIPFADRLSARFSDFIQNLHGANPSPVYVWTQRTVDCGTLLVPSLQAIKWDFDFGVNDEGILALVTSDIADSLLLDFSTSLTGEQRMKVETQGANWKDVIY